MVTFCLHLGYTIKMEMIFKFISDFSSFSLFDAFAFWFMNQSSKVKLAALTIFIFFIGQLLSPTIFPICTIREIALSTFFSLRVSSPLLSLSLSLFFQSVGLVAYYHPAYISKSYDEIRRFK